MTKTIDLPLELMLDKIPGKQKFNFLWGIVAIGVCTCVAWPFRHLLGSAGILMIYNLGVFLVAASYGRSASILASLLSIPAFAFFFAPPIFSFAIIGIDNMVGLCVMLLVANLTSNLLEKIRFQAEVAQLRKNQATALYRLNMDLSNALNDEMLAGIVVTHVYEEFKALSVLLLPGAEGQFHYPDAQPLRQSLRGVDLTIARQVLLEKTLPSKSSLPVLTIDKPIMYLPLFGAQHSVGVLAMQSIDPELKTFLQTYLHQIGQTLERLSLASRARTAMIQAEAEASRNSLLSAISHDLRTPLTRIVGAANTVIEDDGLTLAERKEISKVIRDEAQHMSDLMNKILDMARLAGGAIVLHCEWHALEEIVGGALARLEKILDGRTIHIALPDGLPLVWIDGVLIQQVLINLLENIAKYTPDAGSVDIAAKLHAATVTLAVSDEGPGIPAGAEDQIFEKFYRLESESSKTGIGLGLALCRCIMNAHQGAITAANRPLGGAVFTLTLPLHQPPQMLLDEQENI